MISQSAHSFVEGVAQWISVRYFFNELSTVDQEEKFVWKVHGFVAYILFVNFVAVETLGIYCVQACLFVAAVHT